MERTVIVDDEFGELSLTSVGSILQLTIIEDGGMSQVGLNYTESMLLRDKLNEWIDSLFNQQK